jgi:uncharacterized membrane protein YfcA
MVDVGWAVHLLPLTGFAVGMLVGLTGIGGGALMTPLLISSFGVPPQVAVGTDLLYANLEPDQDRSRRRLLLSPRVL